MAKRFTATDKWDDPFFIDLPNKYKLFWIFMLDKCDHAGIFQVSQRAISFHLNDDMRVEELEKVFASRIYIIDEHKWFIPKFVEFQYGVLDENNRVHKSVINILKSKGAYKGLKRPIQGCKDKDKDKEQEQYKEEVTKVLEYLNEKHGSKYSLTAESGRKLIRARLNDGYTVTDCKRVIDNKVAEWTDTEFEKFLRPSTLFRPTHFDEYLNAKVKPNKPLTEF